MKEANCRDRESTELYLCLQNFGTSFCLRSLTLSFLRFRTKDYHSNFSICRCGLSTVQHLILVLTSHRHSRLPITPLPLSVPAVSLADVQGACADGECSIECYGWGSCQDSVFSCPEEHECLRECSGAYSCGGSELQGPGINGTLCECVCLSKLSRCFRWDKSDSEHKIISSVDMVSAVDSRLLRILFLLWPHTGTVVFPSLHFHSQCRQSPWPMCRTPVLTESAFSTAPGGAPARTRCSPVRQVTTACGNAVRQTVRVLLLMESVKSKYLEQT